MQANWLMKCEESSNIPSWNVIYQLDATSVDVKLLFFLVLHVFLGDEVLTEGIERYLTRVKK